MSVTGTVELTAAACLLTWLIILAKKWARFVQRVNHLPGPRESPVSTIFRTNSIPSCSLMEAFDRQTKKYAPIYRTWSGFTAMVHLTRPEHVAVILSTMKFINKPNTYEILEAATGKGLITANGNRWHTQRLIIMPAFHVKIIDSYQDIFVKESEFLLKKLELHAGKAPFNMEPYLLRLTLDVICGAAVGMSPPKQEDEYFYMQYMKATHEMNDLIIQRCLQTWPSWHVLHKLTADGRKLLKGQSVIDEFINKVIYASKAKINNCSDIVNNEEVVFADKIKKVPLFCFLRQSVNLLSDEEIRDHIKTFITAGFETTMDALCWTLFLLGSHVEVQDKVYDELHNIFHGSSRAVDVQDLAKMKYLEQVIHESLRLYPPAPFILRKLEEDVRIDNYEVPAGSVVNIHIYHLHRCADQFPEPEKFNPDNFLPERVELRHPFSYIPFSAGPRNCVGKRFSMQEQKTVLAMILRKYKVLSTQTKKTISPTRGLTLRPGNGTWITVEERA